MHENDQYIKPHRITDEYYYVGTFRGPANLLVTGDGLVMIDTSYPENLGELLDNIRALGFDPMDIKHIIHTHGHLDHIGCTNALVRMTGAKTYLGAADAEYIADGNPIRSDIYAPYSFVPDVALQDGDVIDFGGTKIRFVATPGHTRGVMSLFMTLHDRGEPYLAGMFGGAGLNTLSDKFFEDGRFPKTMRDLYIASVDKIIDEPVDIHLGNHIGDNGGKIKMKWDGEGVNPYIANNTWRSFLSYRREKVVALIRGE